MSAKRATMIGGVAVGTLAVAGVISAAALSSGTTAASASTLSAPASAVSAPAAEVVAMDAAQHVMRFEQVRFGLQHEIAKASAAKASVAKASVAKAAAPSMPSGSPQHVAEQMLARFGWSSGQFSCLEPLWEHESGWNVTAENPSSGAYGIPQALSGSLMSSSGPDWQTNAATQIRWGLTYIHGRYGSPCGAWAHEEADNWY